MAFIPPLLATLGSALGGITASGIGTALTVGSGILGTVSAVGAANYQAQVAKNNASIAAVNAAKASDQSQVQQQQNDTQTAALVGEQEALQGGSGLSGPSQLRTRITANKLGAQDSLNIRTAGDSNIQQYAQQSEDFKAQAAAARAQATGSLIGGILGIGSSLIGGAKSVANPGRISATGNTLMDRAGSAILRRSAIS